MGSKLGSSLTDDELVEQHEINVTPFIDVMLVLLIIFMVAAPLATVDIGVDLPASTAQMQPRPDKPVFVTVKNDLSVAIGESNDGEREPRRCARCGDQQSQGRANLPARRQDGQLWRPDGDHESPARLRLSEDRAGWSRGSPRKTMSVLALHHHADEWDFRRYGAAAITIVLLHLAVIAAVLAWYKRPAPAGIVLQAIFVDLPPAPAAAKIQTEDLPPGPQVQQAETPPPEPPKVEKVEEQLPPTPLQPEAVIAAPPKEEPKPEKKVEPAPPKPQQVKEVKKPAKRLVQKTTAAKADRIAPDAPAQASGASAAAAAASYRSMLVAHLQRFKRFPAGAEMRGSIAGAGDFHSLAKRRRVRRQTDKVHRQPGVRPGSAGMDPARAADAFLPFRNARSLFALHRTAQMGSPLNKRRCDLVSSPRRRRRHAAAG